MSKKENKINAGTTEKNFQKQQVLVGIFFAVLASFIFASQDAITKTLVKDYPITFIVMVRYWVFFLAGVLMVKNADGGFKKNVKSKKPFVQCVRGLCLLLGIIVVGLSLKTIGQAEMTAIYQSYPLFGTLLAIFILKEKVSWRLLVALGIGFIGILIIIRPGSSVFSVGALWALAAAVIFALYLALTRLVGGCDKPQTSFFYAGLVGMLMTTSGLPFFWQSMNVEHIWLLALICCTAIAAHFCMIKALSLAPLTVVQPINYLQLVWSVILGFIIFNNIPDNLTFVGAFLIVGSGLFVFFYEQFKAKKKVEL